MSEGITSRQRLISAINLEEPDRVPVSFYYVNPYDKDTGSLSGSSKLIADKASGEM